MNDLVSKQIGSYQVTVKIRETSTTALYKAFDTKLGRYVTMQVILPDQVLPANLVEKIKTHLDRLSQLEHPSIARLLDCDMFDGMLCIFYDIVPKTTFKKSLQGTYDWRQAARLLVPLTQALAYAHSQGVLHLAVCPGSILVSQEGALFLFDFGIEQIIKSQLASAYPGMWVGGAAGGYLPPEQIFGKDPDARADIYAAGMLFLELIIGKRLFYQQHLIDEIKLQIQEQDGVIDAKKYQIPPAILLLIRKMIAHKPEKRFNSMLEVSVLFTRIALGQKISEQMVKKPLKTIRPPIKPVTILRYAALSLLLVLVGAGIVFRAEVMAFTQQFAPAPTPMMTQVAIQEVTATSESTPTPKPTEAGETPVITAPTPTPAAVVNLSGVVELPVLSGVALPQPPAALIPENISRLIPYARWGLGKINDAQISLDGKLLGLASSLGVFILDPSDYHTLMYLDTGTWVNGVAFSPDGTAIASAEQDGLVRLWALKDGQEKQTFSGHLKSVNSVNFSPDGETIASTSDDYTVKIWNVKDGKVLQTLSGNVQPVNWAGFSPDGSVLVSGGKDFTIRVWDPLSGKLIQSRPLVGKINHAAFFKDNNRVALAEDNGNVELYDIKDDAVKASLTGLSSPALSVSISLDGKLIASSDGYGKTMVWGLDKQKIWESTSNRTPRLYAVGTIYSHEVHFTPDGKSLVSVNWDNNIQTWSVTDWKEVSNFSAASDFIQKMAITPDNAILALEKSDGNIDVYDLAQAKLLYQLKGQLVSRRAFSPDSKRLAYISDPTTVKVIVSGTGKLEYTLPGHSVIKDINFSSDGRLLGAGYFSDLRIWSVTSGQEIVTKKNFANEGCTIVQNWQEIQLAYSTRFDLIDFPISRHSAICNTQRVGWMQALEFTRQGTWVAAGGPSRIQVWNYTNASKQIEMENTNGLSVLSMEISENGSLVAAALDDLSIRVWNATTGKELARLYGHTSKITELLFTQNMEFLISGALDGTVRIWGIK